MVAAGRSPALCDIEAGMMSSRLATMTAKVRFTVPTSSASQSAGLHPAATIDPLFPFPFSLFPFPFPPLPPQPNA